MSDELKLLQDALGPQYALGAELGRGGMATVYRARDLRHQRDLAVKVIDPNLATAIGIERFEREIAIASSLQHPNIVPLFDSGGAGDLLFYIMPLVVGESLRHRLRREVQLPIADALAIVRDVAAALDYAHARGVVHRDIKPENILLSGGKAVVADFGIARAYTDVDRSTVTELGLALGTPAYMSPEQAGGTAAVDGRADVYALGCVLYEMLAGEPPFTGRTAQAIIARHLNQTPPDLHIVRPTVAPVLQEAIESALAKVPADRFPTAGAFAAALDAAYVAQVSGGTRADQEPGVRSGARRRARSRSTLRPVLLTLAVVGAVALAAWAVTAGGLLGPRTDANRVVVYPLSTPVSGIEAGTGEQVALMIESALEHTEPLRWLDGQGLLGPAGTNDARLLAAEAARRARDAGARYYLDGAIVRDRDTLTVILRLHDAVGDSLIHQESATGALALTSAPQLALRSVARILPRLLPPNGRVDLSYLSDRDPAAVADWLQGEREYARSRYRDALAHLERAIGRDSAMGVAALKGAQAAFHLGDYPQARDLVARSLMHEAQMPRHHLALARGLRFYLSGAADSAIAAFGAARADDPSWSEPWMMLAETYYHMYPVGTRLDSLAEQAMQTALGLQPGFAAPLQHLTEFAVRRGDEATARARLRQFIEARPDSDLTFKADLMVRCVFDGPTRVDWRAAVARSSERVSDMARVVGAGGRHPACAAAAYEAVLRLDTDTSAAHGIFRWSSLKGLDYHLLAQSRGDSARALLDSASVRGQRAAVSLHVLNAVAGSREAEARADEEMRALMSRPISTMPANRLRYVAFWSWHRRDRARIDSVAQRARTIADSTRRGADSLLLRGMDARVALLRGDTASAIAALRSVRPVADPSWLTWDLWAPAADDRLLLAQLLLATGATAEAIAVAELFDSPRSQVNLLYLPASLALRAEAAERAGRRGEAAAYRGRLAGPPR